MTGSVSKVKWGRSVFLVREFYHFVGFAFYFSAMVNLIAVLLVPIAVILSDTLGGGAGDFNSSYSEGKAVWANFGACFFGVILTSMFGESDCRSICVSNNVCHMLALSPPSTYAPGRTSADLIPRH